MSTHATSILRGRHTYLSWMLLITIGAVILSLFAGIPQTALAQVPSPNSANPLTAVTNEDTPVVIDTGYLFDPRYQVVKVLPGPLLGTMTGGGNGTHFTITYAPSANVNGTDTFRYAICTIATAECGADALVQVTITPVNDGPQANPDAAITGQGASITINVVANDTNGPNEPGTPTLLAVASAPAHGTATIVSGQVKYTPNTNYCDNATPDTFTYRVQESNGTLQAVGTVTVTVKCPGTPLLKLRKPYNFNAHTFQIDVILDSADVNVSAIDFYLHYNSCLTDPDTPTDSQLEDNVTTELPGSFQFEPRDQDYGTSNPSLHIIAASVTRPNASILAGPGGSTTERTIATITFKATATATPPPMLACPDPVTFDLVSVSFTGTDGAPINGTADDLITSLASANTKPSDILLSNNKVPEGSPFNTLVGQLSTIDPDGDTTFRYSIAPNDGDNGGIGDGIQDFYLRPFIFNNDELAVSDGPGFPPPWRDGLEEGVYQIMIGSMDSFGGYYEKPFTIIVTHVNEGVDAVEDGNPTPLTVRGSTELTTLLNNDIDPEDTNPGDGTCTNCSIQSVTQPTYGTVVNHGLSVTYMATDPAFRGQDTFSYTLTDNDPGNPATDTAVVTVRVRRDRDAANNEVQYGDCNLSGIIEAGDLTATALELFDAPIGNKWYDTPLGTYAFSGYGCNSNIDSIVDAGDIACTAQKIFNNGFICGNTFASSVGAANLAVASGLSAVPGTTVQVPVILNTLGNSVSAAAFALDFNAEELSFDATDANNDGLPDGVNLNIPAGLMAMATYNADESRVEIVVTGMTVPLPMLADGTIATINLTINEGVGVAETSLALTNSSLGSDQGQSVPVEVTNGTVQIVSQPASRVLLPLISR